MHRYTRLLLTSLAATALLAIAVTSASARNLEISNTRWKITWTELTLSNTAGIGQPVRCRVTLEGSFHARTIPKVINSLIGLVTSAIVDGSHCTNGSATIKRETLPWHVRYGGFTGRLPEIATITLLLVGAAFEINNGSETCSARTEAGEPAGGIANVGAGGAITSVNADPARRIALTGGFCPLARGFFSGEGRAFLQGTTTPLTVRLI
jgi:hypothetical protein